MRTLSVALASLVLAGGTLLGSTMGCSNARFPICESNEDCKDKGDAKFCDNSRCVACRYDDDCTTGYCERKTQECKQLDGPRAGTGASATAAPTPVESAPPADAPPP
jgi:hypothetical protein